MSDTTVAIQGSYRTGDKEPLHRVQGRSLRVLDPRHQPEVISILVFFDDLPSDVDAAGRVRLALRIEVGSGRQEGTVHLPMAPGRDGYRVMRHLKGEVVTLDGRVTYTFEAASERGDATFAGQLTTMVGDRPSAALGVDQVIMEATELEWRLPQLPDPAAARPMVRPLPLSDRVAKIRSQLPQGWHYLQGRQGGEWIHGLARLRVTVGAAPLSGSELEKEALVVKTGALHRGSSAVASSVGPDAFVVRMGAGPMHNATTYALKGWPDRDFYVSMLASGFPDMDAWSAIGTHNARPGSGQR